MQARHEDEFARDASLFEQLLRLSCFCKGKPLRDERFNLFLLKKVEQCDQVLPKQIRFQAFERLNTVGNDPFPARE